MLFCRSTGGGGLASDRVSASGANALATSSSWLLYHSESFGTACGLDGAAGVMSLPKVSWPYVGFDVGAGDACEASTVVSCMCAGKRTATGGTDTTCAADADVCCWLPAGDGLAR